MKLKLKYFFSKVWYYLCLGWAKTVFFFNDNEWNSNRIFQYNSREKYVREILDRLKLNEEIRISRLEVLQRQELEKLKKKSQENEKLSKKKC